MRKRIKFKRTVCSLLALLLTLGSLTALPVFAEAEVTPDPAPVSAPEQPDEPTSIEEVESGDVEEMDAEIVSGDEDDAPVDENTESVGESKVEEQDTDTANPDEEEAGVNAANPDEESNTADDTQSNGDSIPEDEDVLTTGVQDEIAAISMMAMDEVIEYDRTPVSVEGDTLVLRAVAANYLQAHLVFSNDPSKDFVLEVNDIDNYRFLCNWSEINDSRISIEVIPPKDDFIATLRIPLAFLEEYGISLSKDDGITFNNQRYSMSDFALPEKPKKEEENKPLPPYTGITIDGNFSDWDAVAKTDLRNPNPSWSCTMQSAVVWDGDYVYIYFHVDDGNASAIGAMGTHSNGQFAITTDLGNIRLVQVDFENNSVKIFGIDDAKVAVDNYNWDPENGHSTEIAIPTSRLPAYKNSISFGYYQVEPFLKNIANLHPTQGEVKEPDGFACDGMFGEWKYYPHTLIEYDTAGQQESKVDGGAALYVKDGILYGHVKTAHRDHLDEIGGEFLADIEIAFNGDLAYKDLPEKGNFYPKMVTTDGNTTVNEGTGNEKGITTYLISDTRETTPEPGPFFGTMKIKVDGTVDEMEFAIDLKKVAEYIRAEAADFKTIHARFGRIGDEWVETAGTPTGTGLGLALCFACVGGVYAVDHKKKSKK